MGRQRRGFIVEGLTHQPIQHSRLWGTRETASLPGAATPRPCPLLRPGGHGGGGGGSAHGCAHPAGPAPQRRKKRPAHQTGLSCGNLAAFPSLRVHTFAHVGCDINSYQLLTTYSYALFPFTPAVRKHIETLRDSPKDTRIGVEEPISSLLPTAQL